MGDTLTSISLKPSFKVKKKKKKLWIAKYQPKTDMHRKNKKYLHKAYKTTKKMLMPPPQIYEDTTNVYVECSFSSHLKINHLERNLNIRNAFEERCLKE